MRTLAAALLCVLLAPLAQADIYLVKSTRAPLRKAPNSFARVLARATRGHRVTGPELRDGQRWVRVSYRGESGYIYTAHLQRERSGDGERNVIAGRDLGRPKAQQALEGLFEVTASALNVRQRPSAKAPVVGSAPRGTRAVQIQPTNQRGWMRVSVGGVVGYVFAKHLRPMRLPEAAQRKVDLRRFTQAAKRGGGRGALSGASLAPGQTLPAPWVQIARGQLGTNESTQAGRAQIREFHRVATGTAYGASTAWCASFANWCLNRAGQPTVARESGAWARSFMNYGYPLAEPIPGAIAVFTRGDGGHVGFFVRDAGSSVIVLGGNQSNSVCEKPYPKSRLLGYRWPTPIPPAR